MLQSSGRLNSLSIPVALSAFILLAGCELSEFDESMTPPDMLDPLFAANMLVDQEEPEAPVINPFIDTNEDPLATFSVDVDTASYTIMRRNLNEGQLPDPNRIRVEEYINYFKFDYPTPSEDPYPYPRSCR